MAVHHPNAVDAKTHVKPAQTTIHPNAYHATPATPLSPQHAQNAPPQTAHNAPSPHQPVHPAKTPTILAHQTYVLPVNKAVNYVLLVLIVISVTMDIT